MSETQIMNSAELQECIDAMAKELVKRHPGGDGLAIVGIQRRGVFIASRLQKCLAEILGKSIPQGMLDINLYRDDWTTLGPRAVVGKTSIDFDISDKNLVLVDDVLFTGRTIRAALEGLAAFGRPRKVELLVLIDRGHRELPIQADIIGKSISTKRTDRVDVLMLEQDGQDGVFVFS